MIRGQRNAGFGTELKRATSWAFHNLFSDPKSYTTQEVMARTDEIADAESKSRNSHSDRRIQAKKFFARSPHSAISRQLSTVMTRQVTQHPVLLHTS